MKLDLSKGDRIAIKPGGDKNRFSDVAVSFADAFAFAYARAVRTGTRQYMRRHRPTVPIVNQGWWVVRPIKKEDA